MEAAWRFIEQCKERKRLVTPKELILEALKPVPHEEDLMLSGEIHRGVLQKTGDMISPACPQIVRNVEDTSREKSPVQNGWAGYWQDKTWLAFPNECSNSDCKNEEQNPEIVGAHVRKDGEPNTGKDAWIVPLCHKCNSDDNKEPMDLNGGTVFVRVHMSESHKTACPEEDKQ